MERAQVFLADIVNADPEERLERFCYDGDDRNITARYLNGKPADPDEVYERLMKVQA